MTTHYQKIQALGNRMAENLTIMGVPSQFEEGGLTLADKILEISGRITTGVILYGDKKIAQSGDTANLYALVLDDNIAVSGETVRFNGDIPLRSKVLTNATDNVVGDDYYIHSTQPTTNWDFIGDLSINSEKIKIISETFVISEYTYVGMPHIKDGVLTFEDTLGETHTIDVSYTDTTSILTGSYTCTVYYPWVEITTDDDGVATYAYTCTGSGLREFYATYGTFVSETSSVLDCTFYDEGHSGTGHYNDTWTNQANNFQVSRDSEYTTLTPTVSGGQNRYHMPSGAFPSVPYVIEFDKPLTSTSNEICVVGDVGIYMNNMNNANHVKLIIKSNGKIDLYLDGVYSRDFSYNNANTFRWQLGDTTTVLKYCNFEVYPI